MMPKNTAPFIMIGIQRSGSNLLRLMLNEIPGIVAPHPPHILQRMMPLLSYYSDLSQPKMFFQLVDDVCRLVELNPVPWENVVLDRNDVTARCRDNSLVAIFGAVYDLMAEAVGARTWCCKSLANIYYLPEIEHYFDGAKYIYLYRDGRDVAVSFCKAVVGEKHFYHVAKDWAQVQQLALEIRNQVGSHRFFGLSYEDLVGNTEPTLRRLCDFMEVEFTEKMMSFHTSQEAQRTAKQSSLWANVTQSVMRQNTRKFCKESGPEDIRIFESVAGEMLDALGYERTLIEKGAELAFSEEDLQGFNAENARRKGAVLQAMDPTDRRQRSQQEGLLEEIKLRCKL
ncbi:Sulfotransferase [Gammaproteobacteria bacterium]